MSREDCVYTALQSSQISRRQ